MSRSWPHHQGCRRHSFRVYARAGRQVSERCGLCGCTVHQLALASFVGVRPFVDAELVRSVARAG